MSKSSGGCITIGFSVVESGGGRYEFDGSAIEEMIWKGAQSNFSWNEKSLKRFANSFRQFLIENDFCFTQKCVNR